MSPSPAFMRVHFHALALASFVLPAFGGEPHRTASDYLDLCLKADSTESFTNVLMEEPGWEEVQLNQAAADYVWHENSELTAETMLLVSNFALHNIRQGSTIRAVEESLRFFRDDLTFERQLLSIYPVDEHEFFFHHELSRVIAVYDRPNRPVRGCYYAQFGESDWEGLFDELQPVGELRQTGNENAVLLRITPEQNGEGIMGVAFHADGEFLRELLGISKGDLVVFQVSR